MFINNVRVSQRYPSDRMVSECKNLALTQRPLDADLVLLCVYTKDKTSNQSNGHILMMSHSRNHHEKMRAHREQKGGTGTTRQEDDESPGGPSSGGLMSNRKERIYKPERERMWLSGAGLGGGSAAAGFPGSCLPSAGVWT